MIAVVAAALIALGGHALPVHRARVRAEVSAREIARLSPTLVRWRVASCKRRSARTVDCEALFTLRGRPTCSLLIRVRYRSARSRRTVASYPFDPVCDVDATTT